MPLDKLRGFVSVSAASDTAVVAAAEVDAGAAVVSCVASTLLLSLSSAGCSDCVSACGVVGVTDGPKN